jgi:hypothetical protein
MSMHFELRFASAKPPICKKDFAPAKIDFSKIDIDNRFVLVQIVFTNRLAIANVKSNSIPAVIRS